MAKMCRILQTYIRIVVACFFGVVFSFFLNVAYACTTGQIDTGIECVDTKFSVTTTNLPANTEFKFYMSAQGTFYVDCGDGVAISGTGASGNMITRNDTTEALYTCAYTDSGVKTIKFAGLATGYSTSNVTAIRFGYFPTGDSTPTLVAGINGSLGAIFPTLGQSDGQQPVFYRTFAFTKIGSLPENLFSGVTGSTKTQFAYMCYDCRNLTSIPAGLFSGISGGARSMFLATFHTCVKLTTLPDDLFSGITNKADYLFYAVFNGDSGLRGYIPESLFAGLVNTGSPIGTGMWTDAFNGTNLATTCPVNTKQITTGYEELWGGRVACKPIEHHIVTTSYVQGFYEEINTKKQDKLESGVNVITTGAPDGLVVSITADHGVVHVHKEEIQIPVGSVENPSGWLPIWVE